MKTEKDYELLFDIAKAHGVSFEDCKALAFLYFGKGLGELSTSELRTLGLNICQTHHVKPI